MPAVRNKCGMSKQKEGTMRLHLTEQLSIANGCCHTSDASIHTVSHWFTPQKFAW